MKLTEFNSLYLRLISWLFVSKINGVHFSKVIKIQHHQQYQQISSRVNDAMQI